MADNIVKYAIEEYDVKDRRWAIIEECDASKKRMMKMRYKVLCARYPNNSIRLVELTEVVADSRIVNRDAKESEVSDGE